MKDFIYSKNALILSKKADGKYYPFACCEELEQRAVNGLVATNSLGAGGWEHWDYDKKRNWQLTMRGVLLLHDVLSNAWCLSDVEAALNNGATLYLRIVFTDTAGRQMQRDERALPNELCINAAVADVVARWNIVFTGTGDVVNITENYNNWLWPSGIEMLWPSGNEMILANA